MEWKICCFTSKSGGNKMKLSETKLQGVYVIKIEKLEDERGFFARTWDKEFFKSNGLNADLVQCNISFNKKKVRLEDYITKFHLMKKQSWFDAHTVKYLKL